MLSSNKPLPQPKRTNHQWICLDQWWPSAMKAYGVTSPHSVAVQMYLSLHLFRHWLHWNGKFIILTKFLSLAVPKLSQLLVMKLRQTDNFQFIPWQKRLKLDISEYGIFVHKNDFIIEINLSLKMIFSLKVLSYTSNHFFSGLNELILSPSICTYDFYKRMLRLNVSCPRACQNT